MTCHTDTRGDTAEGEGENPQQWNLGAGAHCIHNMVKQDENEAVEEEQEEEGKEQRGHDRGRPPMLRKKKSSYDLRDIFQHQEAEASKSKVSSPVSSPVASNISPDTSKVSSPSTEAPAQPQKDGM